MNENDRTTLPPRAGGLLRPRREEPLPQAQKRGRRPAGPVSGLMAERAAAF